MAKIEAQETGKSMAGAIPTPPQRKIPGNLPYLTASGTLQKVLDRLIEAQRPDKFNYDFLENVLKLTGGGARATITILKKAGFLSSDATPTDLYGRFRTTGGRGVAALQGLRNAFPEIFRRSEYAHTVDENKLKDIVVEITGLKANDPVVTAIRKTFGVLRSFVGPNVESVTAVDLTEPDEPIPNRPHVVPSAGDRDRGDIRLAYNINIVLPETSDLTVLNAIFKSIKENLMQ